MTPLSNFLLKYLIQVNDGPTLPSYKEGAGHQEFLYEYDALQITRE